MRKLEEKREILYVIRTMDVLMSSGVGLEAAPGCAAARALW